MQFRHPTDEQLLLLDNKWLGVDVTCNVTRMGVLCVSDFLTRKQTIVTVLRIYPIISKSVWKHGLALYHLQSYIHS